MIRALLVTTAFQLSLAGTTPAFELPARTTQAVVGITASSQSSQVNVFLYEKKGRIWAMVGGPWTGRVGRNGLAWGRGLHAVPPGASPVKREGDGRSPAGVFALGGAWGYAPRIAKHPKLPYRRVTTRDLWVEDPKSPHYNRHLVLDHEPRTAWEKDAQMKQKDYPHSLKLFIGHNAPPRAVPGAGSSIFFHIWRSAGSKPTAGCTTLPEVSLQTLISRIDPTRNPVYILLSKGHYDRLRAPWKLP